jgi:signal transduction histidine kinase
MSGGRWTAVELDGRSQGIGGVVGATQAPDGSVYLPSRAYGLLRWRDGHLERRPHGDGAAGGVAFDVAVDADGTVWASTDLGIERFRRAPFVTLGPRDGVPLDAPYEAEADATGAIWVAARADALFRLRSGTVREVPDSMTAVRAPIPRAMRYYIAGGGRDGVWIGLRPDGLVHVGRNGLTPVVANAGLPAGASVWSAAEDARGGQWVSLSPGGLGRLRAGRFAWVPLPGANDRTVVDFAIGDSGRFLVATDSRAPLAFAIAPSGTLTRLDSLTPLRHPVAAAAVEGRDTVWAVVFAHDGHVPSRTPSLVRLTRGRAVEVPVPGPVAGLTGFNVQIAVANGALWFASGEGVGRFALATLHHAADRGRSAPAPQTFGPTDGLASPRLTLYASKRMFRAPDGRLWLATPTGLAVADPADMPVNQTPPPVHVEEVRVGGRLLPPGDRQRIAPNPDRIEIHYTAASLRMPERVRLQYRLDGADHDWVEGSVPRVATYTQLRPGHYRFRVRAWNEDGVPSAGEATLAIRVLPAWYQTWWAAALGVLAASGVGAAAAAAVAGVRRRRAEAAQQATVAERVRVARELHDTILSGLAGLTMRLDAAARAAAAPLASVGAATAPAQPADGLLPELRDQARRTLDETRLAVTAMRASAADVVPLSAQLSVAAHRVFAGAPVRVSVRPTGAPRRLAPEVEAEVLRVATEALVNARAHSGCRAVVVTCAFGRSALVVAVRDDGRGFDPALDGAGAAARGHWGLAGMQERARGLGGTLALTTAPGRGTTVRLTVSAPPDRRAT